MAMKRFSFHLSDEQVERLYAVARQRKVAASELVRRFIDQGLARLGAPSELGEGSTLIVLEQHIARLEKQQEALMRRIEEEQRLREEA